MKTELLRATHGQRASLLRALAVLGVLLPACGHSEAAMRAQRDRYAQLSEQAGRDRVECDQRAASLRAAEARNAALADELRSMGGNVRTLEADRGTLQSNLTELEAEHTALHESLAQARAAIEGARQREVAAQARAQLLRGMVERFRSMIAAGDLSVRVVRNRMVVALPEGVLFDTGRADVKPGGRLVLARVAEVLRSMPRDFQVAGHTDNVPIHNARFASNWELATARATNVARLLLERGMAADRLSAAGYADAQPVAANDTAEGRQQNRRTEIVLLPAFDELPDLSSLQGLAMTRSEEHHASQP